MPQRTSAHRRRRHAKVGGRLGDAPQRGGRARPPQRSEKQASHPRESCRGGGPPLAHVSERASSAPRAPVPRSPYPGSPEARSRPCSTPRRPTTALGRGLWARCAGAWGPPSCQVAELAWPTRTRPLCRATALAKEARGPSQEGGLQLASLSLEPTWLVNALP